MGRGKFIIVEGLDGAGKGTAIEGLKKHFGKQIHFTHEPGATPLGAVLRPLTKTVATDSLTHFFLFLADRREHVETVIAPTLKRGTHVVCDRSFGSSYAYQLVAGGLAVSDEIFRTLHKSIFGDSLPDAWIYVSVSPEVAAARLLARRTDRDHFETLEYQRRVAKGYEQFFNHYQPEGTVHRVKNDGSIGELQKATVALVEDVIGA